MNTDPEVMRYFPRLLDRDATTKIVEIMKSHNETFGLGYWPIEVPGVAPIIGFVGLMIIPFRAHFTPCIETGWRLAWLYWGHGYASEEANAAMTFAFDRLPADEVLAFAVQDNRRSTRAMERIGMVRDTDGNVDHPGIEEGSPLRRHCLYRMSRDRWVSMSVSRLDADIAPQCRSG
ncbi:MAG: GNAT family N-acetyltransferase [Geminicoccales bacterium]